jgi:Asp-tRNA(Asn)/Glu-tRNA(Gln) amidotransferase A subunit family amidase
MASGEEWFGGRTRNPWDARKNSGGSSAGPASATAGGCVAFSVGTETNGSMVSPCNECGVTGLRPTFGRVSRHGSLTVSWSFDKVTPICRTAEDCAAVLDAIRGPDDYDNSVIDLPFNSDGNRDVSGLRLGYARKFFDQELMGSPKTAGGIRYRTSIRDVSRKVLDFFESRGMAPVPIDVDVPNAGFGHIMLVEAAAAMEPMLRDTEHRPIAESKWPDLLRRHRFVSGAEYLRATRHRTYCMQQMKRIFDQVDLFIEITWSNNWTTNLTGHPALVVPCGFRAPNRPIGITFVGNLFGEADLLAVAKMYQDGTRHHRRQPAETRLT